MTKFSFMSAALIACGLSVAGCQSNDEPDMSYGSPGVQANRPSSHQPCTPGSTVTANAGTTTCTDQFGNQQTLPNEKGNTNHN